METIVSPFPAPLTASPVVKIPPCPPSVPLLHRCPQHIPLPPANTACCQQHAKCGRRPFRNTNFACARCNLTVRNLTPWPTPVWAHAAGSATGLVLLVKEVQGAVLQLCLQHCRPSHTLSHCVCSTLQMTHDSRFVISAGSEEGARRELLMAWRLHPAVPQH